MDKQGYRCERQKEMSLHAEATYKHAWPLSTYCSRPVIHLVHRWVSGIETIEDTHRQYSKCTVEMIVLCLIPHNFYSLQSADARRQRSFQ
jgi:hypothetical protein